MMDTAILQTPVRVNTDDVALPSLVNICISDELLREIDITVEPTPDGRISINIARRQQHIPDYNSDLLSTEYSNPDDYINRPAITAWAANVASHTTDVEPIDDVYEHYSAQPSEPEHSSEEETVSFSSDEEDDCCAVCGLFTGHCGDCCNCSSCFVSPLTTPLLGPMGTPDISPLSSPGLQAFTRSMLDLDVPRYELEAVKVRPSTSLSPCLRPTQRERLADAVYSVLSLQSSS